MKNNKDGGPAFPMFVSDVIANDIPNISVDISLRDYFAAKAMQSGILRWGGKGDMFDEASITHKTLCKQSYQIADAMLNERIKGSPPLYFHNIYEKDINAKNESNVRR